MATVTIEELSETERLVLEIVDNREADVTRLPQGLCESMELLKSIITAFDTLEESDVASEPPPRTPVRQRLIFRWADEHELPQLESLGWLVARRGSYPGSWLLCREDASSLAG